MEAVALGVLLGMVGLAPHVRGLVSQIGGFSLRNLLSGPPPVLPMAYALVGVLGLERCLGMREARYPDAGGIPAAAGGPGSPG